MSVVAAIYKDGSVNLCQTSSDLEAEYILEAWQCGDYDDPGLLAKVVILADDNSCTSPG